MDIKCDCKTITVIILLALLLIILISTLFYRVSNKIDEEKCDCDN